MIRLSHTDAAPVRPAYNARIPLVTQQNGFHWATRAVA
jgi:hypothetical protein